MNSVIYGVNMIGTARKCKYCKEVHAVLTNSPIGKSLWEFWKFSWDFQEHELQCEGLCEKSR